MNGHDVQPVIEVLAELAIGDRLFQVAVGGGDHPHVDRDLARTAHALKRPLLEHPQQLRLKIRIQLADFVQVKNASLENGLLHVDLVREIPEANKPRTIPISGGENAPQVVDGSANKVAA